MGSPLCLESRPIKETCKSMLRRSLGEALKGKVIVFPRNLQEDASFHASVSSWPLN
jgi:hypothetical protein